MQDAIFLENGTNRVWVPCAGNSETFISIQNGPEKITLKQIGESEFVSADGRNLSFLKEAVEIPNREIKPWYLDRICK